LFIFGENNEFIGGYVALVYLWEDNEFIDGFVTFVYITRTFLVRIVNILLQVPK